ncbi:MAG TPA: hypothetical protein VFP77_13535, partial [Gemmatimonadaceae bacterium]|nr:hypothetical protein [Gemmatimonadaceae bacterium]
MTSNDTRRYNMLKRVRNFGGTYAQLFPTTSTAHDAFGTVNTEIDHLEALEVVARAASDASQATRQAAARRIFQQTLRRAGATARVLAVTNPQLEVRMPLPLPNDDLRLLTVARRFAEGIGPYAAQFATHGIPPPAFEEAIAAFARAVEERGTGRDTRVKARAEIEASFARA